MKIDRISQIFGMDLQKVSGSGKGPEKAEKPVKSDSVSLSKKAKELSSSKATDTEAIARHVDALPDVRAEKVQAAKEKIASGYYNSPAFDDKLADRLMKDLGLSK
jgi:flagellar biosynthesis anti-sigma factor FlgM